MCKQYTCTCNYTYMYLFLEYEGLNRLRAVEYSPESILNRHAIYTYLHVFTAYSVLA